MRGGAGRQKGEDKKRECDFLPSFFPILSFFFFYSLARGRRSPFYGARKWAKFGRIEECVERRGEVGRWKEEKEEEEVFGCVALFRGYGEGETRELF